jgi:CopG family nickel-responsive transcriptional regulator
VQTEWRAGDEVAGAIVLVYDHHRRDVVKTLTDVQHDCHETIISAQHIHLDHDNCLEIVAVRGTPREIDAIVKRLKAVKGLKHISLATGTTGQRLR